MLSSSWHVMLRLTIFEIFTVKWPKFCDWGPQGYWPQMADLSGTVMYHHGNFHADQCHCRRDICNQTEKKNTATNIPFHTTIWLVIMRVWVLCIQMHQLHSAGRWTVCRTAPCYPKHCSTCTPCSFTKQLDTALRWHQGRRHFWHATHDCVAPYVNIILHRGRFWAKSAASGA